jgi:HD-GYP domain-containing protein (c-di-GMP phosphodiesterase class II)
MNEAPSQFIEIKQLRPGLFIELELGWMSHPFPSGSFKISSQKQIEIIRSLGLTRVRYVPGKSDLGDEAGGSDVLASLPEYDANMKIGESEPAIDSAAQEAGLRKQKRDWLDEQQRRLVVCERRFGEATDQYRQVVAQLDVNPVAAMSQSLGLVTTFVGDLAGEGASAIRLLSEGMGDKAYMHPVNVTVIALLLGKAVGLAQTDMVDLGMAAFLHDIGKTRLPDRVRWLDESYSPAEHALYQDHVAQSVALCQSMTLTSGALQAVAQHHELIDGSGFPAQISGERMTVAAKILSLVNRYENLCNPGRPGAAVTPHEAQALIFAHLKSRFDSAVFGSFLRMMGVYPPGSTVQLTDGRFALVVSVNTSRPLKPSVLVYEPGASLDDPLILELEHSPGVNIKRSLKPATLPSAVLEYLSPRDRICYFFERAMDPQHAGESL